MAIAKLRSARSPLARRTPLAAILLLVLALGAGFESSGFLAAGGEAQAKAAPKPKPKPAAKPKSEAFRAVGTVVAVAPGQIAMLTAPEKERVVLTITEGKSLVEVTGTLTPEMLTAGTIVRFTGVIEGTTVQEPITSLTVYTPADGFQNTIIKDADSNLVTVTGALNSLKDGKLSVTSSFRKISAALSPDAVISINTGNYGIVPAGSTISVTGRRAGSGPVAVRTAEITFPKPVVFAPRMPASGKGPAAKPEKQAEKQPAK